MKKNPKKLYPSCIIFVLTASISPVQFRFKFQPKNGVVHPFGMKCANVSGETARKAIMPMAKDATVKTINCKNSVMTTLNIPPFTA